jgi:hypothetical protein
MFLTNDQPTPNQADMRQIRHRRRPGMAAVAAALIWSATAALIWSATAGLAGDFVEPPVFASSNGVLDLLMIAQAQPVPSIVYTPPDHNPPLNPIGWVYAVCPRSASLPGNQCPAGSSTVANYGGVRLALQKGDSPKVAVDRKMLVRPIAKAPGAMLPRSICT